MVEASPAAAFVVTEADLLLELLVIPLDAPAQLGLVDEVDERRVLGQGGEPVFGRFALALWPFDQEPFRWSRCGAPVVPMRRPDAQGGEAGGERSVRALPPGDDVPGAPWQGLRQLFGRNRLVLGIAA